MEPQGEGCKSRITVHSCHSQLSLLTSLGCFSRVRHFYEFRCRFLLAQMDPAAAYQTVMTFSLPASSSFSAATAYPSPSSPASSTPLVPSSSSFGIASEYLFSTRVPSQLRELYFDLLVLSCTFLCEPPRDLSPLLRTNKYFRSAAPRIWSKINDVTVEGAWLEKRFASLLSHCSALVLLNVMTLKSSTQEIALAPCFPHLRSLEEFWIQLSTGSAIAAILQFSTSLLSLNVDLIEDSDCLSGTVLATLSFVLPLLPKLQCLALEDFHFSISGINHLTTVFPSSVSPLPHV